jgi:glyoxylase-like metal-dependent hydrolase (beta-lactamase superfamily II)
MNHLGFNTYLIDLFDLSLPERTGCYVILDDDVTIIETSASPSHEYLLNGLHELGVTLDRIKNIIVTHIHLDHSGGAGLFMQKCPNATLYVHPKGARHLINPSKLAASARQVYGDMFDELFHPIIPVDENRIKIVNDEEILHIGESRSLQFFHTPGHAEHHISIFDTKSKFVYTGDTIGVLYPQLLADGITFVLPSTSPNQFSYESMIESSKRILELNPSKICFGHYGCSNNIIESLGSFYRYLDLFYEEAKKQIQNAPEIPYETLSNLLSLSLNSIIKEDLRQKGIIDNHPVYEYIQMDVSICAMGLILSLQKNK